MKDYIRFNINKRPRFFTNRQISSAIMTQLPSESYKDLLQFSDEHGICKVCVLRLTGFDISTIKTLDDVHKVFHQIFSVHIQQTSNASKKRVTNPCTACLGLFSSNYYTNLDKILNCVKKYDIQKYQLNIFSSAAIVLRNHIIKCKLKKSLPSLPYNLGSIYTVKDTFKHLITSSMMKILNIYHKLESDFQINLFINYPETEKCFLDLDKDHPHLFYQSKIKNKQTDKFSLTSVLRVIDALKDDELSELSLEIPNEFARLEKIECFFQPLIIVGRYNKYSRSLSQTPWVINGERKMESSVQELIEDGLREFISFSSSKFSASGREDVDVRMLGRGRPFLIELMRPSIGCCKQSFLSKIEAFINQKHHQIKVRDLQLGVKNEINTNLKNGELHKSKTYLALCCLDRPITQLDLKKISSIKDLEISQKTPIRVLHRRSFAIRKRTIYEAKGEIASAEKNLLKLLITTESGTYIKEFVHSDFGRTKPSLSDILQNCCADILKLDVAEVNMDWPPRIEDEYVANSS